MKNLSLIVLGLALAGCPNKTPSMPGGGGGDTAASKPLAGTMAEAPKHGLGTLDIKPECHQDNYMVLDVAEGTKFTIDVKPSDGCVHISVMKENGSTNDMPNAEICAAEPKPPIEAVGQAGKTFISMNETGACKGISVSVTFK